VLAADDRKQYCSNLIFCQEGEGPGQQIETLAGDGQRRAFTPAEHPDGAVAAWRPSPVFV
jgi:hypothetical protein